MSYQRNDVHVSQPLTKFALKYIQDEKSMIGDMVAPQVESVKEQDLYYTFDRGNWRLTEDVRAPGDESNRSTVPILSTSTYNIQEHTLHDVVPFRVIDEADAALEPKQDTTSDLMEQLMINKEYAIQGVAFNSANVSDYVTLSGALQWDYTSTVAIIDDVTTGQFTISQNIGKMPNQGVMGANVWKIVKNNDDILDRIKYSQKGILTPDLVAACFDLDELQIGKAVYMSTNPGITSEATAYIWGKTFLLQYKQPRPRKRGMSHVYQFTKKGGTARVKEWERQENDGVWIEPGLFYVAKPISSYCGYAIFEVVG